MILVLFLPSDVDFDLCPVVNYFIDCSFWMLMSQKLPIEAFTHSSGLLYVTRLLRWYNETLGKLLIINSHLMQILTQNFSKDLKQNFFCHKLKSFNIDTFFFLRKRFNLGLLNLF